jgi:hypothetical protein
MVVVWWLYGGCMVAVWWLYGGCMVVVWWYERLIHRRWAEQVRDQAPHPPAAFGAGAPPACSNVHVDNNAAPGRAATAILYLRTLPSGPVALG